jgi:hypothetical protein
MQVFLEGCQGALSGRVMLLPPGEYLFGRNESCHVRLRHQSVSRRHCLLRVTEQKVSIQDLGSRNGTVLNGKRITSEQAMCHNDTFFLSVAKFRIRISQCARYEAVETFVPMDDAAAETMAPGYSQQTSG